LKQINYKINIATGTITTDSKTVINETENLSTTLVFIFDKLVSVDDNMLIQFVNSKNESKTYRLDRVTNNKFSFLLPREILTKGRLYFTLHHYDKEFISLTKYTLENYLYVSQSLDITADTMDERPDIFAEMFYRLQKLEEKN